jgi:hypothetical protein
VGVLPDDDRDGDRRDRRMAGTKGRRHGRFARLRRARRTTSSISTHVAAAPPSGAPRSCPTAAWLLLVPLLASAHDSQVESKTHDGAFPGLPRNVVAFILHAGRRRSSAVVLVVSQS